MIYLILHWWTWQVSLFYVSTWKFIYMGNFSCVCCPLLIFCKKEIQFFQEQYQSFKQFGSRSESTECQSWYGSKLFSKVISRRHKSLLARKKFNKHFMTKHRCRSAWYQHNQIRVFTVCNGKPRAQGDFMQTAQSLIRMGNAQTVLSAYHGHMSFTS